VPGIEQGGILHVRGDNVMLGYLRDGRIQPPESEFGQGWYETGDVVTIEDGFVRLQARLKRFAKVAGEMVSLEVVERIAVAARPNGLHASLAVRDSSRGETILLVTQDASLKRDELQAAARGMGAPEIAVPRRILHMDKIPLLGNGKKDYLTLARRVEETAAVKS
jgi:acyl-[acyl-carrier-protein]-phospholipid O-acyltransferase / long-chain-fatty-acid--[acyl-carrier-protein] ligase